MRRYFSACVRSEARRRKPMGLMPMTRENCREKRKGFLVRLFPQESPINFPGYHALLLSGVDEFKWNPFGQPPV